MGMTVVDVTRPDDTTKTNDVFAPGVVDEKFRVLATRQVTRDGRTIYSHRRNSRSPLSGTNLMSP